MAANDALIMILSRNAFYRRLYLLVLGALMLAWLTIIFLIVMLMYLLHNPPKPIYFSADNVGRLIQVVPVNAPNMKTEEVLAWTKEAVVAAFTFNFVNWRGQLQDAQKFFTTYGWNQYMQALTLSGNLRALTARSQVVTAQVVDQPPPEILAEGILGGAYAWKFRMSVLVRYAMPPFDGSNEFTNALYVETIVNRQSELSSYKGLGIVQLVSNLASSTEQQGKAMTTAVTETSGGA